MGTERHINPPFPRFFEKMKSQKTQFFQTGRNFGDRFLKIGQKSSIFWAPDREKFFDKISIKKLRHTKNFGPGHPSTFYGLFSKKPFEDLFFSNICSNLPRNAIKKCNFEAEKHVFFNHPLLQQDPQIID